MSPILTRPVREQLEHDRVIRLLQARYKRKNEVIINPGNEQNQSITVGDLVVFPDLLLFAEGGRRLLGTVEVETGESVNAIEARAEWGVYSKIRVPLHLYVPPVCVDAAKRLCAEYQIVVAELWTYTTTYDQVRFTMVYRAPDAPMARVTIKPSKPAPVVEKVEKAERVEKVEKPDPPKAKPEPKPKPAAKPKAVAKTKSNANAKPKATVRAAQGRPEASRATKAKAKKPIAKAKPAAKKRR